MSKVNVVTRGASSRWPTSQYCPMRNSDKIAIWKAHPTLDYPSFCMNLFLENIKKFALVKVRLCATCSAKLNSNKKYREVRKEQNRLALLREKEERLDQKREKANYEKRKRKLSEEKSKNPDQPKKKLTDREQKEKIKMDEADLGSTKGKFI